MTVHKNFVKDSLLRMSDSKEHFRLCLHQVAESASGVDR